MGVVFHYCLGRCSALVVCVRRAGLVGGGAGACSCPRPPLSLSSRVLRGGCGGLSWRGFICLRSPVRHSMWSARSRSGGLCVLVRARSRVARPLVVLLWLPPIFSVRALREVHLQAAGWAVHVVRAPPRFLFVSLLRCFCEEVRGGWLPGPILPSLLASRFGRWGI